MKTDYMKNVWEAVDALRGSYSTAERYRLVLAIAFAKRIMIAAGQRVEAFSSDRLIRQMIEMVEATSDNRVSEYIRDILTNSLERGTADNISLAASLLPNDVEELSEIVTKTPLNSIGSMSEDMPEDLVDLILEILDVGSNDTVADLRAETGDFLVRAAQTAEYRDLHGCCGEISAEGDKRSFFNMDKDAIVRMRLSIADPDCTIDRKSMFEISGTFDRVFVRSRFEGLSEKGSSDRALSLLGFSEKEVPPFRSSDWLAALCLTTRLAENGRGVALVSPGSAFWVSERKIRRYLIAQGLVEAIVALPPGLFSYTRISGILLVISRSNDRVRMVDASEVFEKGRRINTLSGENIATILGALRGDEGIGVTVENDILLESDCNLSPSFYVRNSDLVSDGIELGGIVTSIRRGANAKAAELEQWISSKPTQIRYLMLSNIEEGEVDVDLPYLSEVSGPMEKCFAGDGDLVVSKIGPKYKAAVIKAAGEKILCTGNLFIVSVDEDRYDSRFLQMFLQSNAGQSQLNSFGGGTMPSVSMKDLRKIVVPAIPLDEQRRIADEKDSLTRRISYHREAIEQARNEIEDLVNSVL